MSVASAALAAVGGIGVLASATDALVVLMFIATNTVLVVLRVRRPSAVRPFRVWGTLAGVPFLPVVGSVVTVVLLVQLERTALVLAGALVILGYVVGSWFSRGGGSTS